MPSISEARQIGAVNCLLKKIEYQILYRPPWITYRSDKARWSNISVQLLFYKIGRVKLMKKMWTSVEKQNISVVTVHICYSVTSLLVVLVASSVISEVKHKFQLLDWPQRRPTEWDQVPIPSLTSRPDRGRQSNHGCGSPSRRAIRWGGSRGHRLRGWPVTDTTLRNPL
jgi:hypothetical protein